MAFVAGALLAPPLVSAETADRGAQALLSGHAPLPAHGANQLPVLCKTQLEVPIH